MANNINQNTSLGLNAGLYVPVTQGYSAGGSVTNGTSWSATDANTARMWSDYQAGVAYERQKELQNMAQQYNSAEAIQARAFNANEAAKARSFEAEEAAKARWFNANEAGKTRSFDAEEAAKARNYNASQAAIARAWEEEMANTVYTRSAKNMIEAGINPILAFNYGMTGAGVGSGATASTAGVTAPSATGPAASGSMAGGMAASTGISSAPMAQSFMDSQSGSSNYGSSWDSSESGLATALKAMGEIVDGALNAINAGTTLNVIMNTAGEYLANTSQETKNTIDKLADNSGLPYADSIKKQNSKNGIVMDILNAGQLKAAGMTGSTKYSSFKAAKKAKGW